MYVDKCTRMGCLRYHRRPCTDKYGYVRVYMYCLKSGKPLNSPLGSFSFTFSFNLKPTAQQKMSYNSAVEMFRRLTFGASPVIVFLTIVSGLGCLPSPSPFL